MLSFSATVKRELAQVKNMGKDASKAQLAGFTHAAGVLRIGKKMGVEYRLETEESGVAIAKLAKELYSVNAELFLRKAENRDKPITNLVLSGDGIEAMLTDMGLFLRTTEGVELLQNIPDTVYKTKACKRAFLRGVFLGAGVLVNPRGGYHLEFVLRREELADAIINILADFNHTAKKNWRKDFIVVYIKEGDSVAGLLALLGAPIAVLHFEDIRAERELRNYINRTSNCETANIGKTVNAAQEQLDAIKAIIEKRGLESISPVLRETAELRLNNPELSLQEMADIIGIKKSGINNRLQRIIRIANELL